MGSYLVGVDIGGTFTDCVAIDRGGNVTSAKAPSTPADFAEGVLRALEAVAAKLNLPLTGFCSSIHRLSHGTTIGTNAVIQNTGARVGLITTKGHSDVMHIMRGSRGLTGNDLRKVVHFPESSKPEPIVPKKLIEGVSERVDCKGQIIVELNEPEARDAIMRLADAGVEALAVCFLWSFRNPENEQRLAALIEDLAPHLFFCISSDLAPKWGEYERTAAAVINAYIGPKTVSYLSKLERKLRELGLRNPIQIAQCGGGTVSLKKAMNSPLLTLHSGPVSGVLGSKFVGEKLAYPNIITTDMGGTSFDVGLIREGEPDTSYISSVNQYQYFLPKVSIEAIGSGGGSLVKFNSEDLSIKVGPESAGADPGPICYGKGGTTPTVTDAALVVGLIGDEGLAGGKVKLDRSAAETAIAEIAEPLGMSVNECAAGILRIAGYQMADLVRKLTVQKGYDPRDFVLFAFGGAGPLFADSLAFEVGVQKVLIPQRDLASSWCAFGTASADILHILETTDLITSPFPVETLNQHLAALRQRGKDSLIDDGIDEQEHRFQYSIDIRHKGQINEVEVPLDSDCLDSCVLDQLVSDFYAKYEQLYGRGSSFQNADLEAVTYRVRATASGRKPVLCEQSSNSTVPDKSSEKGTREIYWLDLKRKVPTPIFDGQLLKPGNRIHGPAILETPDTSIVLGPKCIGAVDILSNIEISRDAE